MGRKARPKMSEVAFRLSLTHPLACLSLSELSLGRVLGPRAPNDHWTDVTGPLGFLGSEAPSL